MEKNDNLVFLDTETTGLDPKTGHKIVEVGCIRMREGFLTKEIFHHYINPERSIPKEVIRIHGITDDKVSNAPKFFQIAQDFLAFITEATLVAHNSSFDLKFLNYELGLCKISELLNPVIDTLKIARSKFPGSPASLDALCRRFGVSNQERVFHGALLDAQLLAAVYQKMVYGDQPKFFFTASEKSEEVQEVTATIIKSRTQIIIQASPDEISLHDEFIKKNFKNSFWTKVWT